MRTPHPTILIVHAAVKNFFGPQYQSVIAPYMELVEDCIERDGTNAIEALDAILDETEDFSEAKRSLLTAAAFEVSHEGSRWAAANLNASSSIE